MVKLNKIYTRTGDKGTSGLVGNVRRPKHDLRFEAIGAVDEANSMVGISRCHTRGKAKRVAAYDAILKRIQHDLFDLGADLATPYGKNEAKALRMVGTQITRLEKEIDALNAHLAPLNSFVLPGGSDLAATLHFTRTIVRRAERTLCLLAEKEKTNVEAVRYLNRLSDLIFVMARAANENGKKDVLWEPGVNR